MCSRPEPGLYLIQGPPGTGKTNVIKNVVLQLLYGKHRIRNRCILLVAPSNAAVDQLVLKLVEEARPKLTGMLNIIGVLTVGYSSTVFSTVCMYLGHTKLSQCSLMQSCRCFWVFTSLSVLQK